MALETPRENAGDKWRRTCFQMCTQSDGNLSHAVLFARNDSSTSPSLFRVPIASRPVTVSAQKLAREAQIPSNPGCITNLSELRDKSGPPSVTVKSECFSTFYRLPSRSELHSIEASPDRIPASSRGSRHKHLHSFTESVCAFAVRPVPETTVETRHLALVGEFGAGVLLQHVRFKVFHNKRLLRTEQIADFHCP